VLRHGSSLLTKAFRMFVTSGMSQDGPRLKRVNNPKLRLVKRLLRTEPVSLQETRWHKETPETLHHNIPGLQVAHCRPPNRQGRDFWRCSCPHPSWLAPGQNGRNYPGTSTSCRNAGSILYNSTNFYLFTSPLWH